MDKLREFAEAIFQEYNSEGSRRASNIKLVEEGEDRLVYNYDYQSLNGSVRRMSKVFRYDDQGQMVHEGALPVD